VKEGGALSEQEIGEHETYFDEKWPTSRHGGSSLQKQNDQLRLLKLPATGVHASSPRRA